MSVFRRATTSARPRRARTCLAWTTRRLARRLGRASTSSIGDGTDNTSVSSFGEPLLTKEAINRQQQHLQGSNGVSALGANAGVGVTQAGSAATGAARPGCVDGHGLVLELDHHPGRQRHHCQYGCGGTGGTRAGAARAEQHDAVEPGQCRCTSGCAGGCARYAPVGAQRLDALPGSERILRQRRHGSCQGWCGGARLSDAELHGVVDAAEQGRARGCAGDSAEHDGPGCRRRVRRRCAKGGSAFGGYAERRLWPRELPGRAAVRLYRLCQCLDGEQPGQCGSGGREHGPGFGSLVGSAMSCIFIPWREDEAKRMMRWSVGASGDARARMSRRSCTSRGWAWLLFSTLRTSTMRQDWYRFGHYVRVEMFERSCQIQSTGPLESAEPVEATGVMEPVEPATG
ncbi:hypothetical protein L1887_56895 [Cichorium endivia]|nr:hypothetical protein L1887_56895 [Cichorium endivia]